MDILVWCRKDAASRRLLTVPGIRPITASAISAAVPDPTLFRSGRQLAASLGLTPRSHSSGGKERLGGISNQGDGLIRRLLVVGATAVMRVARQDNPGRVWAKRLLERKPARLATHQFKDPSARCQPIPMFRLKDVGRPAPAGR